MKNIVRNTSVVSISLPKNVAQKLEKVTRDRGQSKSAFISSLIEKTTEEDRWQTIYKKGQNTAQKLKITSEDDIDAILHAP